MKHNSIFGGFCCISRVCGCGNLFSPGSTVGFGTEGCFVTALTRLEPSAVYKVPLRLDLSDLSWCEQYHRRVHVLRGIVDAAYSYWFPSVPYAGSWLSGSGCGFAQVILASSDI